MLKLAGLTFLCALTAVCQPVATASQSLAPFIATPEDVVERMLALAKVTRDDVGGFRLPRRR